MIEEKTFSDYMEDFPEVSNENQLSDSTFINPSDSPILPPLRDSSWDLSDPIVCDKYKINGLSDNVYKTLRKTAMQQCLDLHGKTIKEAYDALEYFLANALVKNYRYVEIIHGKGLHSKQGVGKLSTKVREWLAQTSVVQAYCEPLKNKGSLFVQLQKKKY